MNRNLCLQSSDILRNIAINIPNTTLSSLCLTNKECYRKLCNKNSFWRLKFINEFKNLSEEIQKFLNSEPGLMRWKKLYKMYKIGQLYINVNFEKSPDDSIRIKVPNGIQDIRSSHNNYAYIDGNSNLFLYSTHIKKNSKILSQAKSIQFDDEIITNYLYAVDKNNEGFVFDRFGKLIHKVNNVSFATSLGFIDINNNFVPYISEITNKLFGLNLLIGQQIQNILDIKQKKYKSRHKQNIQYYINSQYELRKMTNFKYGLNNPVLATNVKCFILSDPLIYLSLDNKFYIILNNSSVFVSDNVSHIAKNIYNKNIFYYISDTQLYRIQIKDNSIFKSYILDDVTLISENGNMFVESINDSTLFD